MSLFHFIELCFETKVIRIRFKSSLVKKTVLNIKKNRHLQNVNDYINMHLHQNTFLWKIYIKNLKYDIFVALKTIIMLRFIIY